MRKRQQRDLGRRQTFSDYCKSMVRMNTGKESVLLVKRICEVL